MVEKGAKQPNQPLVVVNGVVRFQSNQVVRAVLEAATASEKLDLNMIWRQFHNGAFTIDDMEQFYQLIGYSVSGFGEMHNFRPARVRYFDQKAEKLFKRGG